jgi:Domain of unknown function (DUF5667)
VRMRRSQPNRLHDELDALLDGRPVELTEELAPLAEAAQALRAELAAHQLDPEVANRHLERVLGSRATVVPMPARPQPNGWEVRRRVAAVVLAAALVLAPATMASAAALPGQPMYPFKLAIEQLRLVAVQWSPAREASERTRVAKERLSEVERLLHLRMYSQLPNALEAFNRAVLEAQRAVVKAQRAGEPVLGVAKTLDGVKLAAGETVQRVAAAANAGIPLPLETRNAIEAAVQETQTVVLPPPTSAPVPTAGSGGPAASTPAASATQPSQGPGTTDLTLPQASPTTTNPPATPTSQASTTTTPPTTTPEPTTTAPPTTTEDTTPGSLGADGGGAGGGGQGGAGDEASPPSAPETTVPPTVGP